MVLKKVRRNCVLRNNAKKPILPRHEVIVIYPQRQLVEKDVAIREGKECSQGYPARCGGDRVA
jgi:hypothetical protein